MKKKRIKEKRRKRSWRREIRRTPREESEQFHFYI